MTDIKFLKDRIILDGHADTKQECETITLLCDNLAKSGDFKTVCYESGCAEFEKVGKVKQLKFASALTTTIMVFDAHVSSVEVENLNSPSGGEGYTYSSSGQSETIGFVSCLCTVVLESGYIIDTVTATGNSESSISDITDNTFKYTSPDSGLDMSDTTITITTKKSGNLIWYFNETLSITPTTTEFEINFKSNDVSFTKIIAGGKLPALKYDDTEVYAEGSHWGNVLYYRIIELETTPTGDFLSWLESNATPTTTTASVAIQIKFDSQIGSVTQDGYSWLNGEEHPLLAVGTKIFEVGLVNGYVIDSVKMVYTAPPIGQDYAILQGFTNSTFTLTLNDSFEESGGVESVTVTITSKQVQDPAMNIEITNAYGVRLNTAEKYCEEDIIVTPKLQNKEATTNGVISADDGYAGLNSVSVNVSGGSEGTYTNDTPTPAALGGISKGETFSNVSFSDMFTKLLYPYVKPTVTARSTPNGGVFEKGSSQTVTAIAAIITKGTAAITKVEALDGSTVLGEKTSTDFGSSTVTISVSQTVTINKSFTARVTDSENKTYTANTASFSFVYPYYYGVAGASATINETLIKSLTKSIKSKGTQTVSYTASDQRMIFASPYAVSKIVDPNGFDVTTTFTMTRVSVTGLDETAQSYYVYAANEASTVSAFSVTFTIN